MKRKLKIPTVLVLSFIISSLLVRNAFIGYSPKLNPFFVSNLKQSFANFSKSSLNTLASILKRNNSNVAENDKAVFDSLEKTLLPVGPGVRASSNENYSLTEYEADNVTWVIVEFTDSQGNKQRIQVPKGTEDLYR